MKEKICQNIYMWLFDFIFMMGLLAACRENVQAEVKDNAWLDSNYEYSVVNNVDGAQGTAFVQLIKYKGSDTALTVPEKVEVGGTEYTTYIVGGSGNQIWRDNTKIQRLEFESGIKIGKDLSYLFYGCRNMTSVMFNNIDTSEVTDMSYMFTQCMSLITPDLTKLNTGKVTNMSYMFNNCQNLRNLNLSKFDTTNVTNMNNMFSYCASSHMTSLDVSNFDTGKVTDMESMFAHCTQLTELKINSDSFVTDKVTNMKGMFSYCRELINLDLSKFDTSSVTNMNSMFKNCNSLSYINLSGFKTSQVTDMGYMFQLCNNLTTLDLNHFNTGKVTTMLYMFDQCSNLTSLAIDNFDTSKMTGMNSFDGMFSYCDSLESLDLSSFDLSEYLSDPYRMLACESLKTLKTPRNVSSSISLPTMFYDSDYNFYTYLPEGKSNSILLKRGPADASLAELVINDQVFNGSVLEPEVKVLLQGVEIGSENYSLSYVDNINIGIATVTADFTGNFTGTATGSFTISEVPSTEATEYTTATKPSTAAPQPATTAAKQSTTTAARPQTTPAPTLTKNDIKIERDSADIGVKKKMTVKIDLPAGVNPEKIEWKSSNKKIVSVKPGKDSTTAVLKANKVSTKKVKITVTVYLPGNKKVSRAFYFRGRPQVKSVKIKGKSTIKKKVGKSITLKVTIRAEKGANKKLKWKSDNTRVATVSSKGKVKLKKKGKAKITVMSTDGNPGSKNSITVIAR